MVVNRITTMGGRAGGGARSGGGGGALSRSGAAAIGKSMMSKTQADFDEANALTTTGKGAIGFSINSDRLTSAGRQKLKANGWTSRKMYGEKGTWHTVWSSPSFSDLGSLQAHAKSLIGK